MYAKRLNMKQYDPETEEPTWISSETIVLTFESSMVQKKFTVSSITRSPFIINV
jgi:hypothetical protein